jgi:serine/threonine-protein kinase RsbW
MVRRYAETAGFAEPDQYFIGLAFREIFINAMKHGNGFDATKQVVVHLSCEGGKFCIEVIDEGAGFRLEDVPDPRADENLERRSGRGLVMAMGVMDELVVEAHAPVGTHVRMSKHLAKA